MTMLDTETKTMLQILSVFYHFFFPITYPVYSMSGAGTCFYRKNCLISAERDSGFFIMYYSTTGSMHVEVGRLFLKIKPQQ